MHPEVVVIRYIIGPFLDAPKGYRPELPVGI
jgi:hypothetical protein